jgi:hypothetical protein
MVPLSHLDDSFGRIRDVCDFLPCLTAVGSGYFSLCDVHATIKHPICYKTTRLDMKQQYFMLPLSVEQATAQRLENVLQYLTVNTTCHDDSIDQIMRTLIMKSSNAQAYTYKRICDLQHSYPIDISSRKRVRVGVDKNSPRA